MNIPKIGMGTWGMGGKYEKNPANTEESIKALRFGLELGYRLIDTAELYGGGLAEEILGEAIEDYKREDIFIISKVWQDNLKYEEVIKAAKGSLKRLGVDYIDLYLIHWSKENRPQKIVPLEETIKALEFLAEEKLIKYIGVSNASVGLLKQTQSCLKNFKLAANQIEFNLIDHSAEKEILPYCKSHDIKLIAYRPLVKGDLSWAENSVIKKLGVKYKKTPAQIVLNWLIKLGLAPIPKASDLKHLKENLGALGWQMDNEDMELINKTDFNDK